MRSLAKVVGVRRTSDFAIRICVPKFDRPSFTTSESVRSRWVRWSQCSVFPSRTPKQSQKNSTPLKPRTNSRKIKQESTKDHVIKSEAGSSINDGLCKEYSQVRLILFHWINFSGSVLSRMEIWR